MTRKALIIRTAEELPSQTDLSGSDSSSSGPLRAGTAELIGYATAAIVGTALIVVAAYTQPYNQNEIQQIAPYGTGDISKIIHATRQPPIDPLLGAAVEHVFGVGQLRQRLVPVIAGIVMLIVMSLILRRLRIGYAGVVAAWAMAISPLLIRYSGYARPYALPLMLMLVYVYAAMMFEETRHRRWLVVLGLSAVAMPATRVPEPNVFLGVTLIFTVWRLWRGRLPRHLAIPLIAVPAVAIAAVGYPLFRVLAHQSSKIFDLSPSGFVRRFPHGVHEVFTGFLPLMSHYTPWWPLLVVAVVAVVAIPSARRCLAEWWFFWPLLAAPVVFALAYHFLNPFSFEVRPYRTRMAIFFVPAITLLVAALCAPLVAAAKQWSVRSRAILGTFVAALVLSQLPATANVLTKKEAPDFQQAAQVLTHDLSPHAIVLYDTVSVAGQWRQPFSGIPRYMGDVPFVGQVSTLMRHPRTVPLSGPVLVLLLDSPCSTSVVCDGVKVPWDGKVPGWHVKKRFDRFTLYAPDQKLVGRDGVVQAMTTWGQDLTPAYGYPETYVAASLLKQMGEAAQGKALIARMLTNAGDERAAIEKTAAKRRMDPFQ
ncbi:MAG: glycosyltransferase family 39 protein [Nocardioidaceae bacterium]